MITLRRHKSKGRFEGSTFLIVAGAGNMVQTDGDSIAVVHIISITEVFIKKFKE